MKISRNQLRRLIENIIDADDRYAPVEESDAAGPDAQASDYDSIQRQLRDVLRKASNSFDEPTLRDMVEEAFLDIQDEFEELAADRTMDDRLY